MDYVGKFCENPNAVGHRESIRRAEAQGWTLKKVAVVDGRYYAFFDKPRTSPNE